jgi:2'-5' RNA ligase
MRTFIAFDLDGETKNTIQKIQDNYRKAASGKISYTKPEQFHLTAFFLGEIGEKGAGRIIEILKKTEFIEPVTLEFNDLNYFPSIKRPNVIVLKSELAPALTDFVRTLDTDLLKLGFKRDKKWLPHITLGRIRDSFSVGEFTMPPFRAVVKSLVLYKSTLSTSGSVYEKLFETNIPLQ